MENIKYGFRRNVLGLKPYGVFFSFLSIAFSFYQFYGVEINRIFPEMLLHLAALVVCIVIFAWWLFCVKGSWVRDAGDAYARALLATCELPRA